MHDSFFLGGSIFFSIVPIFIGLIFLIVIGTILFRLVSHGVQKTKPVEHVGAKVVAKREHVWGGDRPHTSYYATFELQSGERREFNVPSGKIGLLAEGDYGTLSFQGTLYVAFSRETSTDDQYGTYE